MVLSILAPSQMPISTDQPLLDLGGSLTVFGELNNVEP